MIIKCCQAFTQYLHEFSMWFIDQIHMFDFHSLRYHIKTHLTFNNQQLSTEGALKFEPGEVVAVLWSVSATHYSFLSLIMKGLVKNVSVFCHSVAKQASSKRRKWPTKENHRTPNSKQARGGRQPRKTPLRSASSEDVGDAGRSHLSLECWSLPEPVVWGHFGVFFPPTWVTETDLWQWASVGGICEAVGLKWRRRDQ